ncbi:MAG: phosphotransferase [Pseudomonadota bacterium]
MIPDLSAWGPVADLRPMAGGARRTLFCGTLRGQPVIAKSHAAPEPSLRWQRRIEAAARRAGLVTPGLIPAATGTLAAGGWTLEPHLPGRPGTPTDLATLPLARFHAAARDLPPRPGPAPRLPAGWARLAHIPGPEGSIHGDLHPGNLLRLPSGRLALLDWAEARRGPVAIDRAAPGSPTHLRAELAACAGPEPQRARAMARALLTRPPRPRRAPDPTPRGSPPSPVTGRPPGA